MEPSSILRFRRGDVLVIAAVVLLVWNSGILQRTLTAVEVDGVKYTAADVEFYYNSTYNQIVNTYTSQYYTAPFDTSVSTHTNLLRLPGAAGAQLRSSIERLCALRSSREYGSDLLAQGALVELMIGLNRAAEERGDSRPAGTSDQVVDAVLHYINDHYSESLTLDQLAEQFYISKYHLLRKFDAQVGTTVHRYILQKRLLNAKQLLAGGVPPNEVCQYCGFGDYANFYRAFKAEYNQTPRQYIQSVRGG